MRVALQVLRNVHRVARNPPSRTDVRRQQNDSCKNEVKRLDSFHGASFLFVSVVMGGCGRGVKANSANSVSRQTALDSPPRDSWRQRMPGQPGKGAQIPGSSRLAASFAVQ